MEASINEGWRSMQQYTGFVRSLLQLSIGQAAEQIKKINLFFEMALKLLCKHFDHWINELLFLSLYSKRPTSKVFATFLFPGEDAEEENNNNGEGVNFYSLVHQ